MIPVTHVITRLTMGGSSENTVSQIEALERVGYASTLVLGPQSEARTVATARRRGCRVVEIEGLVREVSPARDFAATLELVRLFRRTRPDDPRTPPWTCACARWPAACGGTAGPAPGSRRSPGPG